MTAPYPTTRPQSSQTWHRLALGLLLALTGLGISGCTSVDSDMPWNAPPSWQGSPTMPGFGPGGY